MNLFDSNPLAALLIQAHKCGINVPQPDRYYLSQAAAWLLLEAYEQLDDTLLCMCDAVAEHHRDLDFTNPQAQLSFDWPTPPTRCFVL